MVNADNLFSTTAILCANAGDCAKIYYTLDRQKSQSSHGELKI